MGYYPDSEAYGAFMSPLKDTKQNQGKILTSWSDDVGEAVLMCLYKHEVVFKNGEWTEDSKKSRRWG